MPLGVCQPAKSCCGRGWLLCFAARVRLAHGLAAVSCNLTAEGCVRRLRPLQAPGPVAVFARGHATSAIPHLAGCVVSQVPKVPRNFLRAAGASKRPTRGVPP